MVREGKTNVLRTGLMLSGKRRLPLKRKMLSSSPGAQAQEGRADGSDTDTRLPNVHHRNTHKMMMTNKISNKSNYDGVPEKSNLSRTATAAAASGCVNNHVHHSANSPRLQLHAT